MVSVLPFPILSGDVVGVLLPELRPLPILAVAVGDARLLDATTLEEVGVALHLYAVASEEETSGTGSAGITAAVVVVLLLATVAIVVGGVFAFHCYWRRCRYREVVRKKVDVVSYNKTG